MKLKSGFFLRKWYMDCVADNGDAFIGYSATVRYKAIQLRYASYMTAIAGTVSSGSSVTEASAPEFKNSILEWKSPALKVLGKWKSLAAPLTRQLFDEPDGTIEWYCHLPLASVRLICGNLIFEGTGYAECLEMSLPPWRIPIDELRWGRFCCRDENLVWIKAAGEKTVTVVNSNGVDYNNCTISDDAIDLPGGSRLISMQEKRVLREGPLVTTALSSVPGISSLAPVKILQAYECKWKRRAILIKPGTNSRSGWVINEIMRF